MPGSTEEHSKSVVITQPENQFTVIKATRHIRLLACLLPAGGEYNELRHDGILHVRRIRLEALCGKAARHAAGFNDMQY